MSPCKYYQGKYIIDIYVIVYSFKFWYISRLGNIERDSLTKASDKSPH